MLTVTNTEGRPIGPLRWRMWFAAGQEVRNHEISSKEDRTEDWKAMNWEAIQRGGRPEVAWKRLAKRSVRAAPFDAVASGDRARADYFQRGQRRRRNFRVHAGRGEIRLGCCGR